MAQQIYFCKMKIETGYIPKNLSGQRCLLSSHNARTIWFRSFESFTIMCTVCKIITHAFIINIFAQTIYGNNLAFNTKRGVIIFVKWFYYQIIKNYSFVYYEVPWTCFINNFSLFSKLLFFHLMALVTQNVPVHHDNNYMVFH